MLRIGNMDTHQRARENDTVDATQNAPTHHTNEKKIQKDRETNRQDQRRKYTKDLSSTGDESEDGQSSNTHKDQDSDVSFENDAEEEMDTTEIEEEDWIDATETWEMRRFVAGTRLTKNEMEAGAEKSNITECEMVDESCRTEPRTQLKIQDQQSGWKTKEKMGR